MKPTSLPIPNEMILAGEKTGPVSGQPPPASSETASAILGASRNDPMGQHEGGQGVGDKAAGKKIKSEKERQCFD